MIKVYNSRAEKENRIKEGKNTLRWDNLEIHDLLIDSCILG